MTISPEQSIKTIEGSELSSVEFVRDYIQLKFDGPILTTFTLPKVVINGETFVSTTPGYRDALCQLIGKEVFKTHVIVGAEIQLVFEKSDMIQVSLCEEDHVGPEAAMFSDELTKIFEVW